MRAGSFGTASQTAGEKMAEADPHQIPTERFERAEAHAMLSAMRDRESGCPATTYHPLLRQPRA